MPFIRLSDNYIDHPKFLALSDGAFRLWHEGMAFCRKHETDGRIPSTALAGFRYHRPPRVAELTKPALEGLAPLWDKTESGFQVHDYLYWNRSREDELRRKEESRERTERWRSGKPRDASQDKSQHAHVQDRIGSGSDLLEKVQEKPFRGQGSGAMSGLLPRDHRNHGNRCSPNFAWCVPGPVHDKLVNLLIPKHKGDAQAAVAALEAWYPTVWATLAPDFVMGDAFRFWQARFDVAFASENTVQPGKKPEPKSNVPDADTTRRKYLAGPRP